MSRRTRFFLMYLVAMPMVFWVGGFVLAFAYHLVTGRGGLSDSLLIGCGVAATPFVVALINLPKLLRIARDGRD